ncbi:MAG: DMT family transporter [Hyphomicrobiales bacterium]|nr:DMT family transporter [Hyphomicrobiales bacterium]
MPADRPLLGILLMIGFCALAPMGDAIAKVLGATIPLGQLLTVRFAVQVVVLLPIALWTGRQLVMSRRVFRLTAVRTILHIVGVGAMFTSLRYLPLADAVAIAFVMPFIMLLLGKLVLDEQIGARRMIACAIGFIGTLLVVQPSFAAVGWPALWPVLVAVVFALFMLVTRQMAKEVDPISLQVVSGMMATGILTLTLLATSQLELQPLGLVMPTGREAALLATIGVIGSVAHLLMTWSLRFAPSATLAPMQYLEIPFATLFGWLIFRDLPNGLAAIGIVITIAAGLYVVFRERSIARRTAPVV